MAKKAGREQGVISSIYQLKISLKGVSPPVWRRVLVPEDVSLATLHDVIQAVMGWEDYHLHEFDVGGLHYGQPSDEDWYDVQDEHGVRLNQIVEVGARFTYTYDFGDDWEHTVEVEKRLPPDPEVRYPVCIKGKRACPPEDCGGVWGYADMLQILQDPEHEEYEEMLEWVGEEFDPEAFDLDEVNQALEWVRKRPKR